MIFMLHYNCYLASVCPNRFFMKLFKSNNLHVVKTCLFCCISLQQSRTFAEFIANAMASRSDDSSSHPLLDGVELWESGSQSSLSTAVKRMKLTKYDLHGGIDYLASLASAKNRDTAARVAVLLKQRKG